MQSYLRDDAGGGARVGAGGRLGGAGAGGGAPSSEHPDRAARLAELEAKIQTARQLPSASGMPTGPPPEGWRVKCNPDGKFYYVHNETGATQWEMPTDSSAPAEAPGMPATGSTASTGSTSAGSSGEVQQGAEQPDCGGWQQGFSLEGLPYFYHVGRSVTQWEAPAEWVASKSKALEGGEEPGEKDAVGEQADAGAGAGDAAAGSAAGEMCAACEGESVGSAPDEESAVLPSVDAPPVEAPTETEAAEIEAAEMEGAELEAATGLGGWTVVEPSERVAPVEGAAGRSYKRPRGFGTRDKDDDDDRASLIQHVQSKYKVPEVIAAAAMAQVEELEEDANAKAVVFSKRKTSKAGFRKKPSGL